MRKASLSSIVSWQSSQMLVQSGSVFLFFVGSLRLTSVTDLGPVRICLSLLCWLSSVDNHHRCWSSLDLSFSSLLAVFGWQASQMLGQLGSVFLFFAGCLRLTTITDVGPVWICLSLLCWLSSIDNRHRCWAGLDLSFPSFLATFGWISSVSWCRLFLYNLSISIFQLIQTLSQTLADWVWS